MSTSIVRCDDKPSSSKFTKTILKEVYGNKKLV